MPTAVLDTNVLLLHLAGETDTTLLKTFKRLSSFDETDFALLSNTLKPFRESITTPHVLSEISNFVEQAPLYRREALTSALRRFAEGHVEEYEAAANLVQRNEFRHLALTDTGLASLSSKAVVITTDFKLANEIYLQGGSVINFNHLRGRQLLSR